MKIKEKGLLFEGVEVERARDVFVQARAQGDVAGEERFLSWDVLTHLEVYQLKKLNLEPMSYCLKLQSDDRFGGTRYRIEYKFLDSKGASVHFDAIHGCLYSKGDKNYILYHLQYKIVKLVEQLNPITRSLEERAPVFEKLHKLLKKENINAEVDRAILDINVYRVNNFSLDKQQGNEFILTPNIKTQANGIPVHIAESFSQEFLKGLVGQGRKIHGCYLAYSKSIKLFFRLIKEANDKPVTQRRDIFYNPQKYFKQELLKHPDKMEEHTIDDLIDATFKESKKWQSDRIIELGVWIPKANCYLPDPENQNEWISKDLVSLQLKNGDDTHFIHACPAELGELLTKMKQALLEDEKWIEFGDQQIPVNKDNIVEVRKTMEGLQKIDDALQNENKPALDPSANEASEASLKPEPKLSDNLVPLIRDNFDTLVYKKPQKNHYNFSTDLSTITDKNNQAIESLLYPHQKEGVQWLQQNFLQRLPGVILADDMGLGKTLQALTFLLWIKNIYATEASQNLRPLLNKESKNQVQHQRATLHTTHLKRKPFLIVAPRALIKNWQDEHNMFFSQGLGTACQASGPMWRTSQTNNALVNSLRDDFNWTITTYETLRDKQEIFRNIDWGVIIFDEAQKIKNPRSLLSEMAKAMSSDFSIAITGTPIENHLIDLWCIADCVWPKKFGLLKDFTKKYCHPKSDLSNLKQQALQPTNSIPQFLIKRWKDDIGNSTPSKKLPPKRVIKHKEPIKGVQLEAYEGIIQKRNQRVYKQPFDFLQEFRRYMLFVTENVDDQKLEHDNARIKCMCHILDDIKNKGEKALIFLSNRTLQRRLLSFLKNRFNMQYDPLLINGEVSGADRKEMVDKFQKPRTAGFDVFLLGPKSGGVGLTMTAANHIIHLDRWWNPAVEDQCTDRAYRIGQSKQVQVHIPMAIHPKLGDSSFDVHMDRLLENKRKQAYDIIAPSLTEASKSEKEQLYRDLGGKGSPEHYKPDAFYKSDRWRSLRQQCIARYGSICMNPHCRSQESIEVDHVLPRSKYPHLEYELENLQVLCRSCNLRKSDTVPTNPNEPNGWDFRTKK